MTKYIRQPGRRELSEYNQIPEKMAELTEKEFAQSIFFKSRPEKTESRQFYPTPIRSEANGYLLDATLFHYQDKTGIVMMTDYWAGKVRYFRFGCDHQYVETSRPGGNRSGWHTAKCKKCGHETGYDTSD